MCVVVSLRISGISEIVDSSVKRLCSATGNTNRLIRQKYSFRMRSGRWMITVRVWWWWHNNLILRCPENMENQYNI